MNPKLNKTIIVLHISAVIYFLLGIALLTLTILPRYIPYGALLLIALVSIAIGVFVEIIIKGLKDNKFWAWVAGLIISGLYVPSLFIILGIIGLIGLLDKEVRKDFLKNLTSPLEHSST